MSKSDTTGYIYILTNKSFNKSDCIKIGYSDKSNLEERVKALSNTSVPEPFEVYATYEVPKIEGNMPDKKIHNMIQILNPSLRMNASREFFEMEPWDAYEMLKSIAEIHGTKDRLWLNPDNGTAEAASNEEASEYTIDEKFPKGTEVRRLYDELHKLIDEAAPGLRAKATKHYVVFKVEGASKSKCNIVSLWPKAGWIEAVLNAKNGQLQDDSGLIYDISNRRWPSAQYAFKYNGDQDADIIRYLIKQTNEYHK